MQLLLTYEIEGAERTVPTTPYVWMQWEQRTGRSTFHLGTEGLGMQDLLFLAWEGCKAAQVVVPPFDIWAKTVQAISVTAEDTHPTKAVPSAD